MKKVELLSPAGNMDGFFGAIHAGADAVYLGGKLFGARAYADNFTIEEIIFCIRYAHLRNRKVYLTLNTLMKEAEFADFDTFFAPIYNAGLDGVIVQDLGLLSYLHQYYPQVELHASTQMTITGSFSANYLKKYGITRIVPARELSLQEVDWLKKETDLEIECFIHGAMCYCYSGQCLFSSILGGRSGNRGRCAQPCRLPYKIENYKSKEEMYPLSLKDMCTIEMIPALIEAGIDSFKIEGRMKKAEYTAGVTAIYRKYIDQYYSEGACHVSKKDLNTLATLYLRSERHEGYYKKHNGKEMITLHSPSYSGSDENLLSQLRERYITQKEKLSIKIFAELVVGKEAVLSLHYGELSVAVTGEEVQKASKQPITRENVIKQLSKLGDTSFEQSKIEVILDEDAFYSLKLLNELRRAAVTLLENSIIESFHLPLERNALLERNQTVISENETSNTFSKYCFAVSDISQLKAILELVENGMISEGADIYIEYSIILKDRAFIEKELAGLCHRLNVYVIFPIIIRKKDIKCIEDVLAFCNLANNGILGIVVRNLEGLALLLQNDYKGKIVADSSLYVWNKYSLMELSQSVDSFIKPMELRREEKAFFDKYRKHHSNIQMIYGYIPMMVSANCIAKTSDQCNHTEKQLMLTDRYQKSFPVKTKCDVCMNIIYNTVPLSLHNWLDKLNADNQFLLSFTVESEKEVRAIIEFYMNYHKKLPCPMKDFTTGHEKRGIE